MIQIPDDLRTWLAENLMGGSPASDLKKILLSIGMPEEAVDAEIAVAQSHPYIKAGLKIDARLKRREALLKTIDAHKRKLDGYAGVKKVPLPPFADFLKEYYYQNKIGLFSGAIDSWKAKDWTPRKLVDKVGADTTVQIQHGRESTENYETQSHLLRKPCKFGEFIEMVENVESNDFYLTANNQALSNDLKSLLDEIGNIGDGYFDMSRAATNIFLWIGPKGTITPLHHDLTNNMFIQVYGTKRFRLIPSMQVPYMYNFNHVFSDVDLLKHDAARHPDYTKVTPIEIEVKAGDCLFIPIGWWHHVVGETPNISLTFTNFAVENRFSEFPTPGGY